ncbi:MAG: ATP-binding protein [Bacillota bacterium]|nr:ATP-binding protein [Bacillota bacterium]
MKKKLTLYILSIIVFTLTIVTTLFITIVNYESNEAAKGYLITSNKIIASMFDTDNVKDKSTLFKNNLKDSDLRVTFIDKDGHVIFDNMADPEEMDNHNSRFEVIEARKGKPGYDVRYSKTLKKNVMYYAVMVDGGKILRTAFPIETITGFESKYLKYYFLIVLLSVTAAIIISAKFSYVVLRPISELEYMTSRIANGDFDRRVNISSSDEIGQLAKTFNYMADRLQATLNDSIDKQNRLEAILISMDSGVIAVDKKNRIIMINPYAEKIFGIEGNVIGGNLLDIIRDYEIESLFNGKGNIYKEIKILWPKERVLRIKTADIINGYAHIGTVAVIQDITDIKRLENMRSQFVANVSHELKTPLTSIKGFAETIRYVNDDKQKNKFLDIIDEEVDRLTRLISDILTLSDIEQHKEVKDEIINIDECMENVVSLIKTIADKKNIKICIEGSCVPNLHGDKDYFKQMMINLVDNAVKYSEQGDCVWIGKKVEGDSLVIWVKDNGPGIPEENIPRLFERFYRVDKARSRAKGGTGLGLAIVKHIVMSFNGNISAESEEGLGSTFTIKIPLVK